MKDVWGPANIDYGKFDPIYMTAYGENFYNKGNPEKIRAKLDEDAKRILRRTNFHYGMRPADKKTTHQTEFQKRPGGGPPKLTDNIISDLKGDHSCYGIDKENLTTTYGDGFLWNQPDFKSYDNPANIDYFDQDENLGV